MSEHDWTLNICTNVICNMRGDGRNRSEAAQAPTPSLRPLGGPGSRELSWIGYPAAGQAPTTASVVAPPLPIRPPAPRCQLTTDAGQREHRWTRRVLMLGGPCWRPYFETILDFRRRDKSFRAYSPSMKFHGNWDMSAIYAP